MEQEYYYHMFANGDDAKNFIITEDEFKGAFNRFAVCQHITGVRVFSASVEDSHPHALIYGTYSLCRRFARLYETISIHCIARRRGTTDGVRLHCELYEITDRQYLMNVAAYTIVQATKDGKAVMPYDYLYGTGALYFRSKHSVLPWLIGDDGKIYHPVKFSSLTAREKMSLCRTTLTTMPDDWLVSNGFILPTNYVDIRGFENIFMTHNCFRAFLSSGKAKDDVIFEKMSESRGVVVEDLEARRICEDTCLRLFGYKTTRQLSINQRMTLARELRRLYHLSFRQLSFLTKIPEDELRKYVR